MKRALLILLFFQVAFFVLNLIRYKRTHNDILWKYEDLDAQSS